MTKLDLEWGIEGLKGALKRNDNIVIIDQLRFSSTVVTATALGFVIEPTTDKARKTESYSLSPRSFFGKRPGRVVIASPNGAFLSLNAKSAKRVVYGSILNAKSVAEWIDGINEDTTLIAAGEVGEERFPFMADDEKALTKTNSIFDFEDFLAAGAISSFCKLEKAKECVEAEKFFLQSRNRIVEVLRDTSSHRYNASRGNGPDTDEVGKLNFYKVVPKLHEVDGVVEIRQ